ncbi:GNAT family N-acetyltransferase [Chitinophagaceae bacterium LWZ2-11]
MITYRIMDVSMVSKLSEIDRSETIDTIFEMNEKQLSETEIHHECLNWNADELREIQERYVLELTAGGMAIGAFDKELLVGFGVLGHKLIGLNADQLQVDLMYVSQQYRKQRIGTTILKMISDEAKKRGAKYLYISSTETKGTVSFYMQNGGELADIPDETLYKKEPKDIHLIKKLD